MEETTSGIKGWKGYDPNIYWSLQGCVFTAVPRAVSDDVVFYVVISYEMKAVAKEWSIAEKISRLSWNSNPVCPDKNPRL